MLSLMKWLLFVLVSLAGIQAELAAETADVFLIAPLRIEVQPPAQESYLPLSDGAYTEWPDLRGFRFRDVSPRDTFSEPLSADTLARATVEYTFPIIEKVRSAVFYDVGFVNRGEYDFSTANVNSDPSIGMRLDLPIGPVRLDYGIPIQADHFTGEERYSPRLDAPGPGYREQRARFRGP